MGLPWQVAGWNLVSRRFLCAAKSKREWPLLRAIWIFDTLPSGCTINRSVTMPSSPFSCDARGYCNEGRCNSFGGRMSFGVHSFGVARQADRARAAANIKIMFFMKNFHFNQVQAASVRGCHQSILNVIDLCIRTAMGLPWQVAGCNLILRCAFCAAASKR